LPFLICWNLIMKNQSIWINLLHVIFNTTKTVANSLPFHTFQISLNLVTLSLSTYILSLPKITQLSVALSQRIFSLFCEIAMVIRKARFRRDMNPNVSLLANAPLLWEEKLALPGDLSQLVSIYSNCYWWLCSKSKLLTLLIRG
jgi:hypothetical protein